MGVFSELKPSNHSNRNGFDLGRFSSFTTKAGYILPVFQQGTLPSSEYSVDIKQLLRTQPLQKAAFTGMSINYDIVWCPYNHLYSSFNQFISQRVNKHLTVQPSNQHIPQFHFSNFVKRVFSLALVDYILSFCSDMVSTGSDDASQPSMVYRNFLAYSSHLPNESIYLGVLRQLDMFEYCNLLPVLKNLYLHLTQLNYYVGAGTPRQKLNWTKWNDTVVDGNVEAFGVYRLFDESNIACTITGSEAASLETIFTKVYAYIEGMKPTGSRYDIEDIFDKIGGVDDHAYMPNLWSVLAYNKFFSEYYRNTYYDLKFGVYRVDGGSLYEFDYVYLFNMDDYFEGQFVPLNCDTADFNRLLCMFAVKPHAYKKDLFTGVLPSSQFGDVELMVTDDEFHKLFGNLINTDSPTIPGQVYTNQSNTQNPRVVYETAGTGTRAVASDSFRFDPALAISVLETRRADAMQRFKERMLRAGVDAKDIFKAHGWSEPKSEAQYDPIFVGSFDGRLDINVVSSTTETADVQLAQLGSNATAVVEGHKVKISTSDFGVLMVLFHIDKEAPYDAYGMRPEHTFTEAFDYPYPELQNISLAPVPSEYLNMYNDINIQSVIGFLPRAIGYKTAVDKVHGEFYSSIPYTPSVSNPREQYYGVNGGQDNFVTGIFSDWVAPKEDIRSFNNISFLYISPRCTDPIFKVAANSRQDTDNFVINARFDCYAVEPLPVIGLPY